MPPEKNIVWFPVCLSLSGNTCGINSAEFCSTIAHQPMTSLTLWQHCQWLWYCHKPCDCSMKCLCVRLNVLHGHIIFVFHSLLQCCLQYFI